LEGFKYTKAYPNETRVESSRARAYRGRGIDFDLPSC
jgi:hypothetical protein